jgi:hypothetical protein
MAKKKRSAADDRPVYPWHEIDDLYHEVLDLFYGKRKRDKAAWPALRLVRLLEQHDPKCEALLGMDGRALVAELDGDTPAAIRYRRLAVDALKRLIDKGQLAAAQLDPDDYSDRLDLLADLYLDNHQYEEALAALDESERYCTEQGIPFDGADIRADVKRAIKRRKRAAV